MTNVGGGLVSGFRFSHYGVEKKNPFQTRKPASAAETTCPESTENFPVLSLQLLSNRDLSQRRSEEGAGARLRSDLGTAPLEVAALAFLLKDRG